MRKRNQKTSSPIKIGADFLNALGRPFFYLLVFLLTTLNQFIQSLKTLRFPSFSLRTAISFLDGLSSQIFFQKTSRTVTTPKTKDLKAPYFLLSLIILVLTLSCLAFYNTIILNLPSPQSLKNRPQKLTTTILDRNGKTLFKFYQDENRTLLKSDQIPEYVKHAFIAIEDKNFYHHHGISLTGITRAVYRNFFLQQNQGGSTITQQLVKNALLTNEKTWIRKTKEIILSLKVEREYSKDEILEMYLNEVGFGGTAYGIEEASLQYFGHHAKELNLSEAAFLAGLPKAPSYFSPFINPEKARARQQTVLEQMLLDGYITENEYRQAKSEPLNFSNQNTNILAPHFVMYIHDLLAAQYGEEVANSGGLKVTTSLDLDLQHSVESAVKKELDRLKNINVENGAALVTKPQTGEILAMVGSRNYFDSNIDGQVNLTTSNRQPGSSVKPINYALAFEKGISPNAFINDSPISFNIPGSGLWVPRNYDGRFHGLVSLRQALANSYNIPAILLLAKNGVANMAQLARDMGITTWNDQNRLGLSLTLGSLEVKMTDMATVYGVFANNGMRVNLNPILKIENKDGQIINFDPCFNQTDCGQKQVISAETAYIISDILSDNNARADAFGLNSVLNLGKIKAAVKTGTSNDLRDNWTIGYTPDFVVSTWVGNNDNHPMSRIASGVTGASPIWREVITTLVENNQNNTVFSPPSNLVKIAICSLTGTLTCDGCPTRFEFFTKGTEPKIACKPEQVKNLIESKKKQAQADSSQI